MRIPSAVLIPVLLLSTVASCVFAGFFLVFIQEGLRRRGVDRTRSLITWLLFPLAIGIYLAIPASLVVVFTSDPLRHTIAIVLLSLTPALVPLITSLTIFRAGWQEIVGHPAAYGGHPPGKLATVRTLVLLEGLYLLPPMCAWLLS